MLKDPIYDITKSYLDNAENGPFFKEKKPKRQWPPRKEWGKFLGFDVASPIGVPAGPLLNARWTTLALELGFDIVTYKTIRSKEHPAHPVPNMVYIETKGFLDPSKEGEAIRETKQVPSDMDHLALTNSFGIPSRDPKYLIADIAEAQDAVQEGQVLIVSVVGTPREGEDFAEDFAKAAELALEGGAKIIEADFSCPNVLTCEGSIHTNPEAILTISKKMKRVMGSRPLIMKVGVIQDEKTMEAVMKAAAKGGVEAICGINTISMKVVKEDGSPALGPNRLKAGVCGGPIRMAALEFIEKAHRINAREKLGLTIMATGGVTSYKHFDLFFEKGADVAMSAIGMLWNPYLAMDYHAKGEKKWMKK
jgi:dihydroorotate dehydrogenase (NAD+) catalytic subunit